MKRARNSNTNTVPGLMHLDWASDAPGLVFKPTNGVGEKERGGQDGNVGTQNPKSSEPSISRVPHGAEHLTATKFLAKTSEVLN